jgi:hypothetical protein
MRTPLLACLALALPASAANVLVLSSGDPVIDSAVLATLRAHGHACALGAPYYQQSFSAQSLSPYQTVYMQANNNWYQGEILASAGLNLRTWVQNGGRLVTSEWVTYYSTTGEAFATIASILPMNPSLDYGSEPSTGYSISVPDPALDAGLPSFITFWLDDYAGTQIHTFPKTGATNYFAAPGSHAGLVGWSRGSGSVYSFSTTCGPTQLADENFARLLSNVMGPVPCYANCDSSTAAPVLNVNDFLCFLNRFAQGDTYANCDRSTNAPVLNVLDFSCFLNLLAAGCPG